MATVTEMNKKVVDLKLDFLEEQRNLVLQSLDDYINKVIAEGRMWRDITNQNQPTFLHVSQLIDSAVEFLDLKYHEIKDMSVGMIQLESSVPQEAELTESSHLTSAASATSSSLARCHSEADESLLQPVLTRCDLLEQSVDGLQTSTDNLKDAQAIITNQFEHISEKQFDLDKLINDVVYKQTLFNDTQSRKFSEDKKQVHTLIDEQAHIMKQQELKVENLEKQLEILSSKMNELEQLTSSRIGDTNEVKNSVEMINVHLEIIKNQTDSLSSTMDDTSMTVWNLSNKTEAVEALADSLSQQVSSNKQALQLISKHNEKYAEAVKKLEEQSLEAVNRQDLKVMEKQAKETNDTYKMLCLILNKRLRPLEQLRDCLNSKVQARDEHVKQLLDVTKNVEALTTRVADLEMSPAEYQQTGPRNENMSENTTSVPIGGVWCDGLYDEDLLLGVHGNVVIIVLTDHALLWGSW